MSEITKPTFGNFKIILDKDNNLSDILHNNKSVDLPSAFSADVDFNCEGETVIMISCFADTIEIINK